MSVTRNLKERPMTAFVATSSFVNNFYKYTLTSNDTTRVVTGALGAVTGATAANCPAGRILKENGRRLYSNADPGISTFMVGVFDSVTGYSGLIDPNASLFQRYTNERAADLADGLDYSVGSGSNHRGDSTFTWGNVVAGGNLYSSGGFTSTITGSGSVDINFNNGQYFTLNTASGATAATITCSNVPPAGATGYILIGSAGANSVTFGATNFRASFDKIAAATGATAMAQMGASSNVLSNIAGNSTIVTLVSDGARMLVTNAHYYIG